MKTSTLLWIGGAAVGLGAVYVLTQKASKAAAGGVANVLTGTGMTAADLHNLQVQHEANRGAEAGNAGFGVVHAPNASGQDTRYQSLGSPDAAGMLPVRNLVTGATEKIPSFSITQFE